MDIAELVDIAEVGGIVGLVGTAAPGGTAVGVVGTVGPAFAPLSILMVAFGTVSSCASVTSDGLDNGDDFSPGWSARVLTA